MCFPGPSKNVFFRSQDRSRTPKSRRIDFLGSFLAPPWILRGPQNHPKSAKWRQKAPKIIPSLLLELSWNRPFSKIAPRTFLGIIFNDFGWIFNEFQHSFWSFFIIIPSSSGSAASAVRPLQYQSPDLASCRTHIQSGSAGARSVMNFFKHSWDIRRWEFSKRRQQFSDWR